MLFCPMGKISEGSGKDWFGGLVVGNKNKIQRGKFTLFNLNTVNISSKYQFHPWKVVVDI